MCRRAWSVRRARARTAVAPLALVAVLVAGCASTSGQAVSGEARRLGSDASQQAAAAQALTGFAVSLEQALARSEPSANMAVAPLPAAVGLSQVRHGASGPTGTQIDAALGGLDPATMAAGLDGLGQDLTADSGGRENAVTGRRGTVSVEVADTLFAQRATRFDPDWLNWLDARWGTGVRTVDFRSDPETARGSVNTWVDDATAGHIDRLVDRGEITDRTRLLATSAAYLKAPWSVPFDRADTRLEPFRRLDGSTETVPLMALTSATLGHAAGDGWQAVELPYLGDQLSMVLIVPDPGRFTQVEAGLDGAALEAIERELVPTPLTLRLPQFGFTTRTDLESALRAIGVTTVFDEGAQLPGITGDENLVLDSAPHSTYVAADEEGTDAAGTAPRPPATTVPGTSLPGTTGPTGTAPGAPATVTGAGGGASPGVATAAASAPPELTVDRPFLVLVRDRTSGAVLFYGRVVSPGS